jgi:hypothetical protein
MRGRPCRIAKARNVESGAGLDDQALTGSERETARTEHGTNDDAGAYSQLTDIEAVAQARCGPERHLTHPHDVLRRKTRLVQQFDLIEAVFTAVARGR